MTVQSIPHSVSTLFGLARRARTRPQPVTRRPAPEPLYRLIWTFRDRIVVSEPATRQAALAMFDTALTPETARMGRLRVVADTDYLAGGGGGRG